MYLAYNFTFLNSFGLAGYVTACCVAFTVCTVGFRIWPITLSNAELRNVWSHTSTYLCVLMSRCSFAFTVDLLVQSNSTYSEAGCPEGRLSGSPWLFRYTFSRRNCATSFYGYIFFPPNCQIHVRNYVLMLYLYVSKFVA